MCQEVLEADEGLCDVVEFIHGGVDAVETGPMIPDLLTVGHSHEDPAINLERLPVCRSHRLRCGQVKRLAVGWRSVTEPWSSPKRLTDTDQDLLEGLEASVQPNIHGGVEDRGLTVKGVSHHQEVIRSNSEELPVISARRGQCLVHLK